MNGGLCDPDWIQTNDLPDLKSGCSIQLSIKKAPNFWSAL